MEVIIKRSKTRKPEPVIEVEAQPRLQVDLRGSLVMTLASSSSTHPPNWESVLNGHPIFNSSSGSGDDKDLWKTDNTSLELSISSLSNVAQDSGAPSGRRQVMLVKDADLIVAVGKQVRMASLTESQSSTTGEQSFKVK